MTVYSFKPPLVTPLFLAPLSLWVVSVHASDNETNDDVEQTRWAAAEYRQEGAVAISLYLDNDVFSGNNDDADYTGGFAVSFSGADASRHPFSIEKGLVWFDNALGSSRLLNNIDLILHNYEVGLATFTPNDLSAQQAIQNDRPYASLLYIANTRQLLDWESRNAIMTTLSLGVIGSSLGGKLQNAIHSVTGSSDASGWDHQISDGGELTFQYSATWQHYLDTGTEHLQATTSAGVSLGYITEATVGASVRTGIIRTPWWSFNVHNSNYGEKAEVTMPLSGALDEVYVLAGGNVKFRGYNAFLQGQFRDSDVTYDADEVERWVYEGWIGVGCEFNSGIRLNYVLRHQSSELKTGLADRSFTYGELNMSYKF
jgi:hypothetical protein